jgi:hypothetical protein
MQIQTLKQSISWNQAGENVNSFTHSLIIFKILHRNLACATRLAFSAVDIRKNHCTDLKSQLDCCPGDCQVGGVNRSHRITDVLELRKSLHHPAKHLIQFRASRISIAIALCFLAFGTGQDAFEVHQFLVARSNLVLKFFVECVNSFFPKVCCQRVRQYIKKIQPYVFIKFSILPLFVILCIYVWCVCVCVCLRWYNSFAIDNPYADCWRDVSFN